MINKLKLDFSKFTDSHMLTKASQVLQDMTGNPHFPTPVPPLADLQAAVTAYSVALVNATDRGRLFVAEKNAARKALETLLAELGMYVMYVAKGDDVVLTSSGFDLVKPREHSSITNPGPVILTNGESSGELTSRVDGQAGAKGYSHEYTPYPVTEQSQWASTRSSRCKATFTNLQPGRNYAVRVGVWGSNEQMAYSKVVTAYVQ